MTPPDDPGGGYVHPPELRFQEALYAGDLEAVRVFLDEHPEWLNGCRYFEQRIVPLGTAAFDGSVELLRWLIGRGAVVDVRLVAGRTPLARAAWQLRKAMAPHMREAARPTAEAVRVLLDAGADPDLKDDDGQSPDDVMRCVHGYGLREAVAKWGL